MASGLLHFNKISLAGVELDEDGPQIQVEYYNYTGAQANLEAGEITVLRNMIRYVSEVRNPFPTYGGYDGYTKESAERMVSRLMRTRNRAVTARDYEDIITQISYGVKQVRCESGITIFGENRNNAVTIAILLEEYQKGAHIFSERKEEIREQILKVSGLIPKGKELFLSQPHFVRLSVCVWLEKETMEGVYELTTRAEEWIERRPEERSVGKEGRP